MAIINHLLDFIYIQVFNGISTNHTAYEKFN